MPPKTDKVSQNAITKHKKYLLSSGYSEDQLQSALRELHTFFLYHCSPITTPTQAWKTFQQYKYWPTLTAEDEDEDNENSIPPCPSNQDQFNSLAALGFDEGSLQFKSVGTTTVWFAIDSSNFIQDLADAASCDSSQAKLESILAKYKTQLQQLSIGKEDSEYRSQLLEQKSTLEKQIEIQKEELWTCRENDPELVEELEDRIELAISAANIWTENIHRLYSWYDGRDFLDGISRGAFMKQHGLVEDFDEIPRITKIRKTPGKIKEGKYQIDDKKRAKLKRR